MLTLNLRNTQSALRLLFRGSEKEVRTRGSEHCTEGLESSLFLQNKSSAEFPIHWRAPCRASLSALENFTKNFTRRLGLGRSRTYYTHL
jgi:hypothetical protein